MQRVVVKQALNIYAFACVCLVCAGERALERAGERAIERAGG
jgi:hypothetical protein